MDTRGGTSLLTYVRIKDVKGRGAEHDKVWHAYCYQQSEMRRADAARQEKAAHLKKLLAEAKKPHAHQWTVWSTSGTEQCAVCGLTQPLTSGYAKTVTITDPYWGIDTVAPALSKHFGEPVDVIVEKASLGQTEAPRVRVHFKTSGFKCNFGIDKWSEYGDTLEGRLAELVARIKKNKPELKEAANDVNLAVNLASHGLLSTTKVEELFGVRLSNDQAKKMGATFGVSARRVFYITTPWGAENGELKALFEREKRDKDVW